MIVSAIRHHNEVSRTELAKLTTLDKKSITNYVDELCASGYVEEADRRAAKVGRPSTMLRLRRDRVHAIGLSIEPEHIVGVVVDLGGKLLESKQKSFPPNSSIDVIMGCLTAVYKSLLPLSGEVAGVGCAIPGLIDFDTGVVNSSVHLPGLVGVDIRSRMSEVLDRDVLIEEGSLAKVHAEKWFGLGHGERAMTTVDINIGVGAGIVLNGHIHRGASGTAGEIGHVSVEPGGRICRCGKRGCLETYLSDRSLLADLSSADGRTYTAFSDISELSPAAERVLYDTSRKLGLALSHLINLLGPMPIVLNGEVTRFERILLAGARDALTENTLVQFMKTTSVLISSLHDASALGAAACILADIFEIPPTAIPDPRSTQCQR